MTENKENWLYPDASGLYFPHDGFIMKASDGKQYDYEEECELLNEYDKKYNKYCKDVLRLEEEVDYYKTKCSSLEEGLFQQDRKIAKFEKELKEELNFYKNQCIDEDIKYLRENTVWEQMPTKTRTYTKTNIRDDLND